MAAKPSKCGLWRDATAKERGKNIVTNVYHRPRNSHFLSPSTPPSSSQFNSFKLALWITPLSARFTSARAKVYFTNNSSQSSLFCRIFNYFLRNGCSNNPNVPFSIGATLFSSSLVPIPLQRAEVNGSLSSPAAKFGDMHNILYPSGPDGAGNTLFAVDQIAAPITIRHFPSCLLVQCALEILSGTIMGQQPSRKFPCFASNFLVPDLLTIASVTTSRQQCLNPPVC